MKKVNDILLVANRQFRGSDSDDYVFAYDKKCVEEIVSKLTYEIDDLLKSRSMIALSEYNDKCKKIGAPIPNINLLNK